MLQKFQFLVYKTIVKKDTFSYVEFTSGHLALQNLKMTVTPNEMH